MRKRFVTWILHVITPLMIGGLVYIAWRTPGLQFFAWIKELHMHELIYVIRDSASSWRSVLPGWVLYSLPDGLWSYSFTATIQLLWTDLDHREGRYWRTLPIVIIPGYEALQYLGVVSGTFDWVDLLFSVFACILATMALSTPNK